MPERRVSFEHAFDEDKKKPKYFSPRTPWAKYLQENARFGQNRWKGFTSSGQRAEWERLEDSHADMRGAIDWAIHKGFTQSTIASKIIAAVNNRTKSAPAPFDPDSIPTFKAD